MSKILTLLFVLIVGFGGVFALSKHLETIKPKPDETRADDDLYFSAPELAAAGHDFRGLLADWYWINSLQYLGGKIVASGETANINDLKPLNPRLLYPMLDTVTTLDPKFTTVYTYGATVLPAIDNAQAIKLIEKGIAANPDDWRLYNNLGYIYWQMKNYPKAAEVYGEGSRRASAPVWMKQMSAKMLEQGGSQTFALDVYRQMFETAEDEQTRSFAELHYMQVESQIEREAIQTVLQILKDRNNRCIGNWNEAFPLLKNLKPLTGKPLGFDKANRPIDPSGAPYILDAASCRVMLDEKNTRVPAGE